ncbi:protein DBF4 homolog A [Notolabrus celidotus]|uniref:protein DBF4 homolog A n=1 Tax=Notolabrus celidotus TaxID=1203425 RepID=UPI0014905DE6|nr:protein DBF4 homolog A [Notolabrus celidotus]XP_034553268.1 protein DBF4 homolog A [Notolabrus celidotus]
MKENKMKPKRIQKHTGSLLQGRVLSTGGEKAKLSQVKPFAGKVFYLDLPTNRTAEKLEGDIKELGGMVEKFFSKEIKYLVSNKREARYVHCLRQDTPVPSPDSGPSSPHPHSNMHRPDSHGDIIKSKSQGQTEALVTSRGKSLVEKVVKEQERVKMNKILSNALEWGVKILYLDDILAYVHKKIKTPGIHHPATTAVKTSTKAKSAAKPSSQKVRGGRINKPFIKVEDSSRHYRPIYLTMPNVPEFSLKTLPPCSPFCVEDKDPPVNKQQGHSEERVQARKKNRDKKRGGYCECCLMKYENLTTHLQSERHKAFSRSDQYSVVDRLVSTFPCNLIHLRTQVKRPKCSVSSVLVAPRTYGRTERRHQGGLDTAETIKDEQHLNVDERKGYNLGHTSKLGTVPPLICRERDRRSYYSPADKSKHKPLGRKQLCRQNSLTSCVEKAGQVQISLSDMETAPPRGETLASTPSGVHQSDLMHRIISQDMKDSPSELNVTHGEDKASSKSPHVKTNQQKEAEEKQDSSVCCAVPIKVNEDNSAKEETNPPAPNSPPVRKVLRKVKVYKRKRRKVDTPTEHEKPRDSPEGSLRKLWELFESSDDMDVEFQGF